MLQISHFNFFFFCKNGFYPLSPQDNDISRFGEPFPKLPRCLIKIVQFKLIKFYVRMILPLPTLYVINE